MQAIETSPLAALRRSLANHRAMERQLRELIEASPSSMMRMLSAIDLVDIAKKIEAEEKEIWKLAGE